MGFGGEVYGSKYVQTSQGQEAPQLVIVGLTRTNAVLLKPVAYRPQLKDDEATATELHWQYRLRHCREYTLMAGQRIWVDVDEEGDATAWLYDDSRELDPLDYICLLPGEWAYS